METIYAARTSESDRSASASAKHAYRVHLSREILEADEILIASPMWNWSIPSVLRAYFDQIIISGTLGSTDVETILAELTLAGIAPGMESLVGAKAVSIEAARQVARRRAAYFFALVYAPSSVGCNTVRQLDVLSLGGGP